MFRIKTAHRTYAIAATFTFAMLAPGASQAAAQSFNWTGGYIGGHAASGMGTADTTFTPLPDAGSFKSLKPITATNPLDPDAKGLMFGGQGGYNFQTGHFVIGGEGVFSISKMTGTVTVAPVTQNDGSNFDTDIGHPGAASFLMAGEDTKWLVHIRVRAGVQAGQAFVYGAFGPTIGSVNYTAETHFGPTTGVVNYVNYLVDITERRNGWHWGGGVEVAASKKVSLFGDFISYDLKERDATVDPVPDNPPFQVKNTWLTKATVLRGGVNFRF